MQCKQLSKTNPLWFCHHHEEKRDLQCAVKRCRYTVRSDIFFLCSSFFWNLQKCWKERISSSRTRHGSSLEGPLKLDEIKKAELDWRGPGAKKDTHTLGFFQPILFQNIIQNWKKQSTQKWSAKKWQRRAKERQKRQKSANESIFELRSAKRR